MNHLKSLCDYIEALAVIGEVQAIDREVDWRLEIGVIARRCYETGAPAPLFNTIKGIEKGFRVLGAPGGVSHQPGLYLSRLALSLGLPSDSIGRDIIAALSSPKPVYHVTAMTYRHQPILPISVAGEPVEENHTAWGMPNAAEIVYTLRTAGYPVAMA